jgi:putative ABC transport system permease protein
MMESLFKDIRYGVRSLVKHRGFTAVAVITLALGIGANATIFSVVNAVLLKSLPYPEADRLVAISENSRQSPDISVSYPDYLDWRARQTVFENMSAHLPAGGVITGAGEPDRVLGRFVSASFFSTLGIQPAVGRAFTDLEDTPGNKVMVISHVLWQRRFGGAPAVIGKAITYNGEPWTVVGVMPAEFDFYGRTNLNNDIFIPLGTLADQDFMRDRQSHMLRITARLRPGIALEEARSQLHALAAGLATDYPASNTGIGVTARSFLDDYVGDSRRALLVIFAAVAFMLLIASANVANLMLARATTRRREIAVRLALGASKWRIARQLMTESLILAVAGGLLGVLLANWGVSLILKLNTGQWSRLDDATIDVRVLGFTLLITVLVGLLFGLAPVLQSSKSHLNDTLKEGNRSSSSGVSGRLRGSLVTIEIALSLMLLIGAGLTLRSFGRLVSVDPGYDPHNVLTFRLRVPDAKYAEAPQILDFDRAVIERVTSLPGVTGVAAATGFPLGRAFYNNYTVEGQPDPQPGSEPLGIRQDVSETYHSVLNISLRAGRLLTPQDTATSPLVLLVDEEFAAKHFPNRPFSEVIGKRVRFGGDTDAWSEIVGVVSHVKQNGLDEVTRPQFYRPWTQITANRRAPYLHAVDILVKTSVEPTTLIASIKKEIQGLDRDQPIAQIQTLADKLDTSVAPQRFTLVLLGVFASIALLLAGVGIYGVMSYAITQRTHEIGIRMALGARTQDVLKMVVANGMRLAVVGVAIGLAGAFALTRLMSSLLFGVTPTDTLTFVLVSLALIAVSLLACYIPARRAAKVDPLVALRYE